MMIVTSVGGHPVRAREEAERALEKGSDLVEFRMDLIWNSPPPAAEVGKLVQGIEGRSILTWRSRGHGGTGAPPPPGFLRSLSRISRYVDVELELAETGEGVRLPNAIYSWHDPSGTPEVDELVDVARRLLSLGGLAKVVTLARDELEAYRVLALYRRLDHRGRLVAFSMGERASFSRRMAPLLGSPLVYAFSGEAVAPGQISLDEALLLRELLS